MTYEDTSGRGGRTSALAEIELQKNLDLFRDCLSGPLVQRLAIDNSRPRRKRRSKGQKKKAGEAVDVPEQNDTLPAAEELTDFVDYVATETFSSFTEDIQSLSYSTVQNDSRASENFGDPLPAFTLERILTTIPPSVAESLEVYGVLESQADLAKFLAPILQEYVNVATAAPPIWSTTRASACEICERDWIPLTYHHLIPKQIHAKAIKRSWHEEWQLNSVAWLCRACHSFVHRIASNEELAKDYWSVEKLMEREDVLAWAKWVGRVRWKASAVGPRIPESRYLEAKKFEHHEFTRRLCSMRPKVNPALLQDACIFCATRIHFASSRPNPRVQRRLLRSTAAAFRPPAQASAVHNQEEYPSVYAEAPKQTPSLGGGGWGKASFSVELTPEEEELRKSIQQKQFRNLQSAPKREAPSRSTASRKQGLLRFLESEKSVPELRIWDCQKCHARNHHHRTNCQNCNRLEQGPEAIQWRCSCCGWHNVQTQSTCGKCNSFHFEDGQMADYAKQWSHVSRYRQKSPTDRMQEPAKDETPEELQRKGKESQAQDERNIRLEQTKNGRFVAFKPKPSQENRDQSQIRTRISGRPSSQLERPPVAPTPSTRLQAAKGRPAPGMDQKQSGMLARRNMINEKRPVARRHIVDDPNIGADNPPLYNEQPQHSSRSVSAESSPTEAKPQLSGAGWGSYDSGETTLSEAEMSQRPVEKAETLQDQLEDGNSSNMDAHGSSKPRNGAISDGDQAARSSRASKQHRATSTADLSWLQSLERSSSPLRSRQPRAPASSAFPPEVSKELDHRHDDISWFEATSSRTSSKAVDRDRVRVPEAQRSTPKLWGAVSPWGGSQTDDNRTTTPARSTPTTDQFQSNLLLWGQQETIQNSSNRVLPSFAPFPGKNSSRFRETLQDVDSAPSAKGSDIVPTPYHRSEGKRKPRHIQKREEVDEYDDDYDYDEQQDTRQKRREHRKKEKLVQKRALPPTPIYLPEYISISNLARVLRVRVEDFSKRMQNLGFEETNNDHVLDSEVAGLIAAEFNFEAIVDTVSENQDLQARPPAEDKSLLPSRPPIVTIMGHVDHGKTTLLDYLRKSSVAASEHGGITQHIGAFSVPMSGGRQITFLDTPGHAAFLSMRQRGANVTDIVILVVAADDSVKPQTIEAIKHAQAAKVPMIVAINKIDKEDKNIDRVKQDLARYGVEIEDFGGDTQVVCVSGKTGQGLDELEEAMIALADLSDMRAETGGQAEGWVIEAMTKKAGRVATVLVKRGTMRRGDIIVAGSTWAKVRTLKNEAGVQVPQAGPGIPVEVDGWKDQPIAGDEVLEAESEQQAKSAVAFRIAKAEKAQMATDMSAVNENRRLEQEKREAVELTSTTDTTLPTTTAIGIPSSATSVKDAIITLPLILKADVSGSIEACLNAITALGTSTIHPQILRSAVGPISESDISLAASSGSQIVNFNQTTAGEMGRLAERENVKLVEENVIYRLADLVKGALEALLPVKIEVKVLGEAEVAKGFEIGIGGRKKMWIAGCRIRNGNVGRNGKVRVLRGGEVVFNGQLSSLKNLKKDITEARKGMECGMSFEDWSDFKEGDQVQSIEEKE
ncbi:MAG: hypothetical protein Q9224_003175, partial [Gallowayella concinna]